MSHRLLVALLAVVACGGRPVDEPAADEGPSPDLAPERASDGSVMCREDLTACDGACFDLESDDANCGACGHECRQAERFGHCEAGACPSALYCSSQNAAFRSCDDVCAAHGQRCDEWSAESESSDRGCAGDRFMFYDASGEPGGAFLECELGFEPYETFAECSEAIDWQIFADTEPFTEAVACCCTQEPT